MKIRMNRYKWLAVLVCCAITDNVLAIVEPSSKESEISNQQLIYQQERQKALENILTPQSPSVRLMAPVASGDLLNFPQESICFNIQQVELLGREDLPFTIPLSGLSHQAEGRCLGGQGINLLMTALQNRLISYGYITTRVVAPEQDLTRGTLSLLLVKGTVRRFLYRPESDTYANLNSAMPIKEGKLLNLRDIEQGLENLQRVPTSSAKMQLVPGNKPGESDIIITRNQSKYWRIGVSLDDSGSKETGRYQGSLTLYLDNPLALSDTFYISGGHDINGKSAYGSKNYLFSYTVPFGYWQLSASWSGNTYHQTIADIVKYEYRGRSKYFNAQLSRVIHRNETQKTTISYGINLRNSHNYVDDTEIEVQRRNTTNWRLGVQHRHYFDRTVLDIGATYQKGVRWFGADVAPEEYSNTGSALTDIIQLNLSLQVPFSYAEQHYFYLLQYQGQMTRGNKLTPQDRFSIGSRWTVRGFDGEQILSADNGWFVRNELSWYTPYNQMLYFGLDAGEVSGASSQYLLGKRLIGSTIGLRGEKFGIDYDIFAAAPIHKPKKFETDDINFGFNFNWTY